MWYAYQMVKKVLELFIRFDTINVVTDKLTDTAQRHRLHNR